VVVLGIVLFIFLENRHLQLSPIGNQHSIVPEEMAYPILQFILEDGGKKKEKNSVKKLHTAWPSSWLVLYPRNGLGLTSLTRSLGRVA
jgi:hypothetical protein